MSHISSWFSRFRSSSKSFYHNLRTSNFHYFHHKNAPVVTNAYNFSKTEKQPWLTWESYVLPLALAVSAGTLAYQPHFTPSLCDASDVDTRIGGKGNTQFVVKGSHQEIPKELIEELKVICQDNMTLDYDERYIHGKPQNSFHKAVNIPDVIVYPRSEEEVSKIVKLCNDYKA